MAEPEMLKKDDRPIPKSGISRLHYLCESFRYHWEAREEQLQQYRKDLNMRIGEQWSDDDKAILKKANKPALVFNHIGRLVDLLCGYERNERRQIVAKPIDDDDIENANVATQSIKYLDNQSRAEYEKSQAFDDMASMGEGILGISYDDAIGGYRLAAESVFSHVPDRECMHRTWDNATTHFRFKWMSEAAIANRWPDKVNEITEMNPSFGYMKEGDDIEFRGSNMYEGLVTVGGSHSQASGDYPFDRLPEDRGVTGPKPHSVFYNREVEKYRVVECYEQVYLKVDVITEKTADGKKQDVQEVPWVINKSTGFLVQQEEKIKQLVSGMTHYEITEKRKPHIRLTVFAGDVTLEDGFTVFRRMPFVPYYWMVKHNGLKKFVQGFVRRLVDAQMAYNKAKSQELHAISTSTGFILILNKQLVRGVTPDTFTAALQNFNAVITTEATTMKEGVDYTIIKPGEAPYQLFQNVERLRGEIPILSGIDEQSMLGQSVKGDPSGWALEVKQKQQVMQIATPFDNIREATLVLYEKVLWPLLQNSDISMRIRKQKKSMEEPDAMQILNTLPVNIPIGDLNEDERTAFKVSEEDLLDNPDKLINDMSIVNVDIVFDETDLSPTERQRVLGYLVNMAKMGIDIPPEILFEYMDEPVSQKLLELFRQASKAQQSQPPPPETGAVPQPQVPGVPPIAM